MSWILTVREVAADLAGYLCGTNSRALGSRRWIDATTIAAKHRYLPTGPVARPSTLGGSRWDPDGDEAKLRDDLLDALVVPGVLDLIIFGSQARGGTTGYSDVDALLILDDGLADDAMRLRVLRPQVLEAQRAVLAYQPMQHHSFLVATPRLLTHAALALGMPCEAFTETASLFGRESEASFSTSGDCAKPFSRLAGALIATHEWPSHPWVLHGRVSMFELLPTLYLQATSRPLPKHASFAAVAKEFHESWWPYERLNMVRLIWPREQLPALEVFARLAGNPWVAVAAWRRLPTRPPREITKALTNECLASLHELVAQMLERAR